MGGLSRKKGEKRKEVSGNPIKKVKKGKNKSGKRKKEKDNKVRR